MRALASVLLSLIIIAAPLFALASEGKGLTDQDRAYLSSIGQDTYNDVLKRLPPDKSKELHALINDPKLDQHEKDLKVMDYVMALQNSDFGRQAWEEEMRESSWRANLKLATPPLLLIGIPIALRLTLGRERWRRWRWKILILAALLLAVFAAYAIALLSWGGPPN